MVDQLLAHHALKGRTQAEVIELLGKPDEEPREPNDTIYYLGGYGFSIALLVLSYEDGRVVSYDVELH